MIMDWATGQDINIDHLIQDRSQLEKLVSEYELLKDFFDESPFPYILCDKDSALLLWNQCYYNMHIDAFKAHKEKIENHEFNYEDIVRFSVSKNLQGEALEDHVKISLENHNSCNGAYADRYYPDAGWVRITKFRMGNGIVAGAGVDITSLKEREAQLEQACARADALQTRLKDAIEILDDGFVIFDENDRLLICNKAFRKQFGEGARFIVEGETYYDMTLNLALSGLIPGISGREEEFVQALLEQRKSEEGYSNTFIRHDGKWIRQRDKRTSNGDLVGVRTEITELKQKETEILEREALINSILEASENGLLATNKHGKLIQFNEKFLKLFSSDREMLESGITYEEMLEALYHQKSFAEHTMDGLNAKDFVASGMAVTKKAATRNQTLFMADGKILRYRNKTMDGGIIVHSYIDITSEKQRLHELEAAKKDIELTSRRLQNTTDAMSQGIISFERGKIIMYNPKALELLGVGDNAIFIGQTFAQFHKKLIELETFGPKEEVEKYFQIIKTKAENGESHQIEHRTKHGLDLRLESAATEKNARILTITDITEIKKRDLEIQQSSQLLSETTATMSQGIIVTGPENIEFINDSTLKLLELPEDVLAVGKSWLEFIKFQQIHGYAHSKETGEKFLQGVKDNIKNRTPYVAERQTKSGKTLRVNGNPSGQNRFILTYTDITDLKKREEEIKKTSRLLQDTTDAMIQGILVFGDENIEFVNPEARNLLEVDDDILQIGQPYKALIQHQYERGDYGEGEEAINKYKHILERIENGNRHHIERTNKSGRILRVDAYPSKTGSWIATYTDITDIKAREISLEKAKKSAESAERAKSEFLANMSHEIRTPMNGVMGMAELLSATELDGKQRMFTDVIIKSGASLLTIINDILDFSKIDAGQMELDPAPFNLAEAIEDVATLVSSRVAEKDLELIVRIDPQVPESLIGDVGRIRQIVTNLLGNAVKFTEKGHVYINVEATEKSGGEYTGLKFSVEDTGIGIPEEKCRQVFQKFSQVDTSATRKHEGTGLGLSIASSLVELMNGEIGVESQVDVGTTFWFTIDLQVNPSISKVKLIPGDLTGARILIIDDNQVNRSILTEQTKSWNFDSAAANSGAEGLEFLKAAHQSNIDIDLIILDYQMPNMNGAEVLETLRKDENLSSIPVLMLTSIDSSNTAKTLNDLGAEANLIKPTRSSLLFDTIVQVITNKRGNISGRVQTPIVAKNEIKTAPTQIPTEEGSDETIAETTSKTTEAPQTLATENSNGLTQAIDIYLAEDNEVNQIVFRQILEDTGLSYKVFDNGARIFEAYKKQQPRLMLMDISMPEMNGKETTLAIREFEQENNLNPTPIICITAHALKGDMESFLEVGMNDYLSKPVSPNRLSEKIEQWIDNGIKAEQSTG